MKAFYWAASGLMALVLAAAAFACISPDYDVYIVRSESMSPAINMGDIVVTGPVHGLPGSEIKPGTIITYRAGTTTVTHRVLSASDNALITKGDAVEDPDPRPVSMSQIAGAYLFRIPKAGYLAAFLHTKVGWLSLVVIPTLILGGFIIKGIVMEALQSSEMKVGKR
jgi:signal peptidase I